MAEQQQERNYDKGKFDVVKTSSSQYGDAALDFYDSLAIEKVRLNMINKHKDKPSVRVEHYIDVDEFLMIAEDIITGRFKEATYYSKVKKRADNGQDEVDGQGQKVYVPVYGDWRDRKGGPKKEKGKIVRQNGQPVLEARHLTITYEEHMRIPYKIEIAVGKGSKVGAGAVNMIGAPERKCGIRLTETQIRSKLSKIKTLVEQRLFQVWAEENVDGVRKQSDEDRDTDLKSTPDAYEDEGYDDGNASNEHHNDSPQPAAQSAGEFVDPLEGLY